jgi:ligand-binding sensor domain-containing protein
MIGDRQGGEMAAVWDLSTGRWESYTTADGLPSDRIHALAIDDEGYLWVATDRTGGRFDGTVFENVVPVYIAVMDLTVDGDGRVWMADGRGVDVYDHGELTTYDYESGLTSVFTEAALADTNGRVWVGIITGDTDGQCIGGEGAGGVNMFEDGAWTWMDTAILFSPSVKDLAEDQDGNVWAAGDGGVARFDGAEWAMIEPPEDHPSLPVNSIAVDPDGHIWAGTRQLGLWVHDGQAWSQITTEDGLPGETVWAIEFDDAGRAWVGTGDGLGVFNGENWITYTTEDGLANNTVRAFAVAEDGVWIGTWRGLSHLILTSDS